MVTNKYSRNFSTQLLTTQAHIVMPTAANAVVILAIMSEMDSCP